MQMFWNENYNNCLKQFSKYTVLLINKPWMAFTFSTQLTNSLFVLAIISLWLIPYSLLGLAIQFHQVLKFLTVDNVLNVTPYQIGERQKGLAMELDYHGLSTYLQISH